MKYFKYAIGEIILVVIGILIALQIDAWNDYRKDRKEEQLILTNFKKDLAADRESLERNHELVLQKSQAIDTALLMINGHLDFNFGSFAQNLLSIMENSYFANNSSTFDQSINAVKMDLILDGLLRSELLRYYKYTNLNFEDNLRLETNQDHVLPNILAAIAPNRTVVYELTGIETNLPELDLESLATNEDFYTWVIYKQSAFQSQSVEYSILGERVDYLTELIDKHLDD